MANPGFGAMVSESGLGCTWAANSQANRLTPWHNDPVTDPQSEAIYIRDDETGAIWTPTPLPVRENDAYRTRHGQGYTTFEHNSHAIGQELTVFVPVADPVKVYRLRLRNDGNHPKRLTITYFAEWVLGPNREDQQIHVHTSRDEQSGALIATQTWNGSFTDQIAFAVSSPKPASYSTDRVQFLGRNGAISHPFALGRVRLDNRTGAGIDPAAALQLSVSIEPGHETEVSFLLGEVANIDAMRGLIGRYSAPSQVEQALSETRRWWDDQLGSLHVRTPLLSVDFLLNRWLPLPDAELPFLGAHRFASIERSVWISRPVAGFARLPLFRAASYAGPYSSRRGASVSRRRRAALVAWGNGFGRTYAMFRRYGMAPLRGRALRGANRRRRHSR